jgi:hypothetical protein
MTILYRAKKFRAYYIIKHFPFIFSLIFVQHETVNFNTSLLAFIAGKLDVTLHHYSEHIHILERFIKSQMYPDIYIYLYGSTI